jgi:hypothetical protein
MLPSPPPLLTRSTLLCLDADGAAVPLSLFFASEDMLQALEPQRDVLTVLDPAVKVVRWPAEPGAVAASSELSYTAVQVMQPAALLINGKAAWVRAATGPSLALSAYDG